MGKGAMWTKELWVCIQVFRPVSGKTCVYKYIQHKYICVIPPPFLCDSGVGNNNSSKQAT